MMQVLAVFLVVATICIFAVGKCSDNQIKEKNDQLFGRWNEVFLNVDEEDVEYFRQHAFVDDYSIQNIQEKIYLEGDDRIIIGTCDDNFFDLGNLEMVDGRMPVNEGEVAIEEEYLEVLGVEKVGDIISEGVNIDSLKGYKVCGIVKDYSSRWKMVNWDVKYINCFISDANANEIQIYASLSSAVQQDIETNMLEYRENISINTIISLHSILSLWGVMIIFEAIITVMLRLKIHKYLGCHKTEHKSLNSKVISIFQKSVLTLFKLTLYILIIVLVNRVVVEVHYNYIARDDIIHSAMESMNYGISINELKMAISNLQDKELIILFLNRRLISHLNTVIIIFWICVVNYLIINMQNQGSVYLNKEKIYLTILTRYYYGNANQIKRKLLFRYTTEQLIIMFIASTIVLGSINGIHQFTFMILQNIFLSFLFGIILSSVQISLLFRGIDLFYKENDWFAPMLYNNFK